MITVRDIISAAVRAAIPDTHTHGRLLLKSSPLNMETIFGTIKPKNGKFPITAATIPTATAIRAVPTRTIVL